MKKYTVVLLALALVLTLAGCRGEKPAETTPPPETTDSTPTGETVPTTTAPAPTTEPEVTVSFPQYGLVVVEEVFLCSEPGGEFLPELSHKQGEWVTVYSITDGWAETDNGWLSLAALELYDAMPDYFWETHTVTGDRVNVRSGPGTDYAIVKKVVRGEQVEIGQQFHDGELLWGDTGDGWICMDYVYRDGSMADDYGIGKLTGSNVNIRSGPGTNYDKLGQYQKGDVVEIYKILEVNGMKWGCTDAGWVCMDYVDYSPM